MTLPPALIPPEVTLTVLVVSAGLLMVNPLAFTTVLPVVTLPLVPRSMSSANFTVKVSVPLATTPMLLSVNVPDAPPLTCRFSPNLRVNWVSASSVNPSGVFATAFNCATFTASLSSEPAATWVIWRVAVSEPTETAPKFPTTVFWIAVLSSIVELSKPNIWLSATVAVVATDGVTKASRSATLDEPSATPFFTMTSLAWPKATAPETFVVPSSPIWTSLPNTKTFWEAAPIALLFPTE